MQAEIITIGDELLIGQVVDTNSAWMAERLNEQGIEVCQITSIHDNRQQIIRALDDAFSRADIVLTTGERVTSIVNGKDCVFSRTDHNGWCYCLIEKAHAAGKIDFKKPISCHLYPIRLSKVGDMVGLEYHRWDICHCARQLGKKLHLPIYRFLKEPLIRRFGEAWYNELDLTAEEWKKQSI